MMLYLAWFGLGAISALIVVCLVMLEHMRRLDRDSPPVSEHMNDEVLKALAEWDTRFTLGRRLP